jgi:hypothetical protein
MQPTHFQHKTQISPSSHGNDDAATTASRMMFLKSAAVNLTVPIRPIVYSKLFIT